MVYCSTIQFKYFSRFYLLSCLFLMESLTNAFSDFILFVTLEDCQIRLLSLTARLCLKSPYLHLHRFVLTRASSISTPAFISTVKAVTHLSDFLIMNSCCSTLVFQYCRLPNLLKQSCQHMWNPTRLSPFTNLCLVLSVQVCTETVWQNDSSTRLG